MKKISEFKNDEALDLLAEIIDPTAVIMADNNVKALAKDGDKLKIVKYILKNHKESIIAILAALDGVPVDEYEFNVFTLPMKLLEILNDKELVSFFMSQEWTGDVKASGVPMANTTGEDQ